jgi:competence protein ComEC
LIWRAAATAPDGRLHLTVLDVGNGDGLLIQTPGGRYLLVDGGGSATMLSDALGRRLPLGLRRLDLLIVAGIENEQLEALPRTLERYPAAQVLWSGPTGGTRGARLLREYLAEAKTPISVAQSGQVIDLGEGAQLKIVSANQRGLVLSLEWENFRAFLPVGLDKAALAALCADPVFADVNAFLLPDGGYAPLNPPALIHRLHPQLVLLSIAAGNSRNLPDATVTDALDGYRVLRTDWNGWIELTTDGEKMWVEVERK